MGILVCIVMKGAGAAGRVGRVGRRGRSAVHHWPMSHRDEGTTVGYIIQPWAVSLEGCGPFVKVIMYHRPAIGLSCDAGSRIPNRIQDMIPPSPKIQDITYESPSPPHVQTRHRPRLSTYDDVMALSPISPPNRYKILHTYDPQDTRYDPPRKHTTLLPVPRTHTKSPLAPSSPHGAASRVHKHGGRWGSSLYSA